MRLIFLLLFLAPALARAAAESETGAELGSTRPWGASLELESGQTWQKSGPQSFSHSLNMDGSWQLKEIWKLGLTSEIDLATTDGTNGFRDSELYFGRTGLPLGSFTQLDFCARAILPTDRTERDAGMIVAPGLFLGLQSQPFSFLAISFESKAARFLRNQATAEKIVGRVVSEDGEIAEPGEPAAATNDRWRLENNLTLAHSFLRHWKLEAKAGHTLSWKWVSGREGTFTLEQKLSYEWGKASIGFGHRNETKVLSQNGEGRSIALFRPEESKLFGTVAWSL